MGVKVPIPVTTIRLEYMMVFFLIKNPPLKQRLKKAD
jgi:hypothetical protein